MIGAKNPRLHLRLLLRDTMSVRSVVDNWDAAVIFDRNQRSVVSSRVELRRRRSDGGRCREFGWRRPRCRHAKCDSTELQLLLTAGHDVLPLSY